MTDIVWQDQFRNVETVRLCKVNMQTPKTDNDKFTTNFKVSKSLGRDVPSHHHSLMRRLSKWRTQYKLLGVTVADDKVLSLLSTRDQLAVTSGAGKFMVRKVILYATLLSLMLTTSCCAGQYYLR